MKRILLSMLTIGTVGSLSYWGVTNAFFSDSELSADNVFASSALDLQVSSTAYHNGLVCNLDNGDYVWQDQDSDPGNNLSPELLGQDCTGSWELSDLGLPEVFFSYTNLMPGSGGDNSIGLRVFDTDAWAKLSVINTMSLENDVLSSELAAGDDNDIVGELQENLTFSIFLDQGDIPGFQNVDATGNLISPLPDPTEGDHLSTGAYDLVVRAPQAIAELGEELPLWTYLASAYTSAGCDQADGQTNYGSCHGLASDGRVVADTTYYWGVTWHLPDNVSNIVQTDAFMADIQVEAEQWSNNATPFN